MNYLHFYMFLALFPWPYKKKTLLLKPKYVIYL